VDRRIIFLLVFIFTLASTVLVAVVSLMNDQGWIRTAIYSLATMWIVGVVSQLLIQHLYLSIVKPMDDSKREEMLAEQAKMEINLDEIEEIDQVIDLNKGNLGEAKRVGAPVD
jgi:uncharacterized membrane protein SpoIIM required for sporulation